MGDYGQTDDVGITQDGVPEVLEVHFWRDCNELLAKCLVYAMVELEGLLCFLMLAEIFRALEAAASDHYGVASWINRHGECDIGDGEVLDVCHSEGKVTMAAASGR
eukprot:scaffold19831_cov40-Attheya_sp.AAC.1